MDFNLIEHTFPHTSSINGEILLFRTLWNNSNDNMFIVSIDEDGDFISEASNSSLEKTFKFESSKLVGLKLKDILDEVTFKTVSDRYNKCISLNKPITYDESATIDDTGKRFWNTTILPVIDDNGAMRIFGISREFTKLKNIDNKLKIANEKLEEEVKNRTKELNLALDKMEKLSITDGMTGIFNRRYFDEMFIKMINISKRRDELFCFMILDIDFFKEYNDLYGHLAGDKALINVASTIKQALLRGDDYCFRLGGEEFGIIINVSDKNTAIKFANRLKSNINALKIPHNNSEISEYLTVSIGMVCKNSIDIIDKDELFYEADTMLYMAKDSGRNKLMYLSKATFKKINASNRI